MSVHYFVKLKMLTGHMLPLSFYTKKLIPSQLWPLNSPYLNSVDNTMWEILQELVYKARITDMELSTTPLTNGCRNDDMAQLGPLRFRSLFQFVQISDVYFVHLLLQQSLHAVMNCIQISRIWGPAMRWNKFCSFFL